MVPQSNGKIFLAEERGCAETDWFRSYHTFNFGSFQHPHKSAAGPLYVLNDDTLAGGRSITLTIERSTAILLLPVVGAIAYYTSEGYSNTLEAGEGVWLYAPAGSTISISNPYENELVNYIQLWLQQPVHDSNACSTNFSFDLAAHQNQLQELYTGDTHKACYYIGRFDGRAECTHHLNTHHNALFLFVLEGAFEVQYRLMHARDGLLLWDISKAEIEALSQHAIILAVTMHL